MCGRMLLKSSILSDLYVENVKVAAKGRLPILL